MRTKNVYLINHMAKSDQRLKRIASLIEATGLNLTEVLRCTASDASVRQWFLFRNNHFYVDPFSYSSSKLIYFIATISTFEWAYVLRAMELLQGR